MKFLDNVREITPSIIVMVVGLMGAWLVYNNVSEGKSAGIDLSSIEPAGGAVIVPTINYDSFEPVSGIVPPQPEANKVPAEQQTQATDMEPVIEIITEPTTFE